MYTIDKNSDTKPMTGMDADKKFELQELIDFCDAHGYSYEVNGSVVLIKDEA